MKELTTDVVAGRRHVYLRGQIEFYGRARIYDNLRMTQRPCASLITSPYTPSLTAK